MPLYALEDLDDALAVTRALLTPIDRTIWVKLALVAFFIGGPGEASIRSSTRPVGTGTALHHPVGCPGSIPAPGCGC